MRRPQVLTYLNWLIGLALVVLLGAVYWWAWRPLPVTAGEIHAPLSGPATIVRDGMGVPHIQANSVEDALFLQGYATAQDRLWQMEALRRFAGGELSEIIGPATLEVDRESHRLRMGRLAQMHAKNLPAEDRRWMEAYARGVNFFIDGHRNQLPAEFTLLRCQPRQWTVADSILIGLLMYRDLTSSWRTDLVRAVMTMGPEPALARQLFPKRTGLEFQPGSNAWVIGGKHTASGKPLLANDPHLEWGIPSTWYMVGLQAPNLHVAGVSLPGVPAVIIGHNDRIAWGVTNLEFDVQDLYLEKLDLTTGKYTYLGKPAQASRESERILVKGGKPVEFQNWVTAHGPVWNGDARGAVTLRWTAAEPGRFEVPFTQLNMARNWEEFRAAVRRLSGPGQNFVYADVDGNIGYQATGALPVRRGFDGSIPADGAGGKFEWEGFAPFEDLPSVYNPPSGRIVTANQNPFPLDWKYQISGEFDPGYRARQIRSLLEAREGWKPGDMLPVQTDVYSAPLHSIAKEMVRAADYKKTALPGVNAAAEVLRSWNGQVEKSLAAPMVAVLAYQHLRRAVGTRAGGGRAAYEHPIAPAVIDKLVHERSSAWFRDWDAELVAALQKAVDEGAGQQGSDVRKWSYGRLLTLEITNPVLGRLPVAGKYFNSGPEPMSGASSTVKQTSRRLGPSMRFVADLSDWKQSLNNITVGQSGQVLSKHYRDQWSAYLAGRSFPMPWGDVQGETLRVTPGK